MKKEERNNGRKILPLDNDYFTFNSSSNTFVKTAGGRIRTCEGTKPLDLKSSPFDRSGTPA